MTCAEHSSCCPATLTAEQVAADSAFGQPWFRDELHAVYGPHTAELLWRNAAAIWRTHYRTEAAAA